MHGETSSRVAKSEKRKRVLRPEEAPNDDASNPTMLKRKLKRYEPSSQMVSTMPPGMNVEEVDTKSTPESPAISKTNDENVLTLKDVEKECVQIAHNVGSTETVEDLHSVSIDTNERKQSTEIMSPEYSPVKKHVGSSRMDTRSSLKLTLSEKSESRIPRLTQA